MSYQLTYKPFGERSILIEWPQKTHKDILTDVLNFKSNIQKSSSKPISQVNHAYNSLLVTYEESMIGFEYEIEDLKRIYKTDKFNANPDCKLWKIPVCYDIDFGIDIEELAKEKGFSVNEVIKIHTQTSYTVYFIGFLPGFLYLGGLDKALYTPRKATPRLKIERGAVAIGGEQTGVYPSASPGGWNIIGNSPIHFFNVEKESPCFASAGDQIQFYSVSKKEHADIQVLVNAGVYQIESEVILD